MPDATPSESLIIFTPIPTGIEGPSGDRRLKLSIYATFRLTKDSSVVGDYPDVRDWPGIDANFDVTISGESFPAEVDTWVPRDLGRWQALFPLDANVIKRDAVEDNGGSTFRSFSAKSVAKALDDAHINFVHKHPLGLPPSKDVVKTFKSLAYPDIEQRDLALQAVEHAITTTGTTRFSAKQLDKSITEVTQAVTRRKMRGRSETEIAAVVAPLRKTIAKRLTTNVGRNFMVARAFRDTRYVPKNPIRIVPESSEFDFHERLSALNGHFYLLRHLGIVRDVFVPIGEAFGRTSNPALVDVTATADWVNKQSETQSFTVKAMIAPAADIFRTATRQDVVDVTGDANLTLLGNTAGLKLPRRLEEGYIKLSDPKWELVTLNIEEAELQMEGVAINIERFEEVPAVQLDKSAKPPDIGGELINPSALALQARARDASAQQAATGETVTPHSGQATPVPKVIPPTLRSSGIYLVRDGIEAELQADVKHMTRLDNIRKAEGTAFVCAEDLTRGYAIDIWDGSTQRWYSLCERTGRFEIGSGSTTDVFDAPHDRVGEAAVVPALAGLNGGLDHFVMHPALVNWTGWSLAARMPGKLIASTGSAGPGQPVIDPRSETPPGFPLRATYSAKAGSLPRLRFGVDYRMRARAVDIAGNAIPLDEARDDKSVTIGPVTYRRYEPIPGPYLLSRTASKDAEFVERMVLRSNHDLDVDPDEIPERLVLPPRTAWSVAEMHGAFDNGGRVATDAYDRFADPLFDPLNEPHKEGGSTTPAVGDRDPVIDDTFEAPYTFAYLPEASTRVVKFNGLPGTIGDYLVDLYDEADWPYATPFVIKLIEGTGPPQVVIEPHAGLARKVLEVKLPKGRAFTVRYSSVPIDPSLSALYGLAESSPFTPAVIEKIREQIRGGQVHLYTPSRDLILVHAVLQPNAAPLLYTGGWRRALGQTFALLHGKIQIDRPSTGRVHLRASWTEFLDLAASGPTTEEGKAIVADVPVGFVNAPKTPKGYSQFAIDLAKPEIATGSPQPNAVRHEFADTKHRKLTYVPVASSRFGEYFPRDFTKETNRPAISIGKHVDPDSVIVQNTGSLNIVVYERDVDWELTEGSDGVWTVARLSGGAIGSTEFIRIIYRQLHIRVGPAAEMRIASSARPAAPKVAFITPAFRWEPEVAPEVAETGTATSKRHGHILRVWMDRPWYSSGEDERLGVLLLPENPIPAKGLTAVDPYVTQFAADPLFKAAPMKHRYATTKDFPAPPRFPALRPEDVWGLSVHREKGVRLAELPNGARPTVLAYNVAFDAESKRWYSDVSIEIGDATTIPKNVDKQYFPFVRLALVRYQQHSLDRCQISPVVRADFVQLAPDRSATVVRNGNNLNVTVQGYSYLVGPAASAPRVTAQMQGLPVGSADFEWVNIGDEIALTGTGTALNPTFRTWTGSVAVPNTFDKRLVIREYETYEGIGQNFPAPNDQGALQQRMVYMDIIPVV